ncbi:RTT109 [Candida margitis]|uniref:RTT109 n=1 Tax=Candida margitis TaxID=1775924 RepID=UPI0022274E1F|nr:RTT109 [Candida margitis]KAI5970583.1 RTT109 [Candida margitis]
MSLDSLLAQHLPQNESFKYFYIQSRPIYIKSPINIAKSSTTTTTTTTTTTSPRPDTVKIRHLFTLIDHDDVIVLGIEVYVYLQIYPNYVDQFIFIAKCDTTGLKKLAYRVGDVVESVLRYIVDYDVNEYRIKMKRGIISHEQKENEEQKEDEEAGTYMNETLALIDKLQRKLSTDSNYITTLPYYGTHAKHTTTDSNIKSSQQFRNLPTTINSRICLFTKTAPQYMFPNSSRNEYKHLSNGQVLLTWWLRIIESICGGGSSSNGDCWPIKRLIIPGSDEFAMSKFINRLPNWSIGHIFGDNNNSASNHDASSNADTAANSKSGLAVYNIPLFPDDPKGRFLEHLIVENRYANVSIDRFYQELGYRQEFRIGDCVGLIGCKIDNHKPKNNKTTVDEVNQNEGEEDDLVVTVHQYKQFVNHVLKSINFDKLVDVEYLTQVQIPAFFNKTLGLDDGFKYGQVIGKKAKVSEHTSGHTGGGGGEKKSLSSVSGVTGSGNGKANDLTGLIKRKKRK